MFGPVGCGLFAMVVADSAFVLAGLALSRASPLPQGLWSVGGIGWPWCVSGFAVHLSIEGGWAGAIASRASLYV